MNLRPMWRSESPYTKLSKWQQWKSEPDRAGISTAVMWKVVRSTLSLVGWERRSIVAAIPEKHSVGALQHTYSNQQRKWNALEIDR